MMAEKITDEQLRKQLIEFGERNIGAITDSTRPIYLKKINHLKARQKQNSNPRNSKSTSKKLLGFSSDESDNEETPAKNRRQTTTNSRKGRLTVSNKSQVKSNTDRPDQGSTRNSRSSAASSLVRPALRTRSQNINTSVSKPSTSQVVVNNRRSSNRINHNNTLDESNNASYISDYYPKTSNDSIGLQTSLAEESQESEGDYDIPESFASSDSDLDISKVPDFGSSAIASPEYVNRSINTSFPLDSTYGSDAASQSHLSDQSDYTSFVGNKKTPAGKPNNTLSRRSILNSASKNQAMKYDAPFKPRARSNNQYTFEENTSWRSSLAHHVSMFLVILFALFFLSIGFMYWNMKTGSVLDTAETGNADAVKGMCKGGQKPGEHNCISKEDVDKHMENIIKLGELLDNRASQVECGYVEGNKNMSREEVMDELKLVRFKRETFPTLLKLVSQNKQWQIRLLDDEGHETSDETKVSFLESEFLSLPLWCRLNRALTKVFNILVTLSIVALLISLGLAALRWRWRHQAEETSNVYDLVEKIIDILKNHNDACQDNTDLQPYMAIPHVRDMLIPPKERRRKQTLWDKAVKFLSANESRVRVEMKTIQGEDFAVWRWLQTCPNGSKVWQGQAFGESKDGSGLNSPRYSPSPCLKIRNMFDLDVEYGDQWHVYIQDAILEKCGPDHRIKHIAVDKSSREGCVYVKCADEKASGLAYKALHGWWFDGNLVTVKYLRLERYHERFPDTVNIVQYLEPSNNQRKSLSQPFYHSVMEAS